MYYIPTVKLLFVCHVDRYLKYHQKFCKVIFTKGQGFNHILGGLEMFGGLKSNTLEEQCSSKEEAREILQKVQLEASSKVDSTWQEKSGFVLKWMCSTPRFGMSFWLAANKFISQIRSGTSCAWGDIKGASFKEKLEWLCEQHNPKLVQNFLLAVIADIAGVYPQYAGLQNHPFFKRVIGVPSMGAKNEFVKMGKLGLLQLTKKLKSYAASPS